MPFRSGPTFSKWTGLLLAGDFLVFSLSVLLGYLLGAQITGEQLFLQEYFLPIVILGLVYLVILYIGELYNYYLDFRQRENIGQVILWALGCRCGGPPDLLLPYTEASPPTFRGMAGPGLYLDYWWAGAIFSLSSLCPSASKERSS